MQRKPCSEMTRIETNGLEWTKNCAFAERTPEQFPRLLRTRTLPCACPDQKSHHPLYRMMGKAENLLLRRKIKRVFNDESTVGGWSEDSEQWSVEGAHCLRPMIHTGNPNQRQKQKMLILSREWGTG